MIKGSLSAFILEKCVSIWRFHKQKKRKERVNYGENCTNSLFCTLPSTNCWRPADGNALWHPSRKQPEIPVPYGILPRVMPGIPRCHIPSRGQSSAGIFRRFCPRLWRQHEPNRGRLWQSGPVQYSGWHFCT